MKYCKYLLLSILVILVSCQKEDAYNNVIEGEGGFSLAIDVDDSKTTATRAALTESELRAGASVKIYKPANQGLIREYTYGSMPEVVYLPASTAKYRVDVIAGEAAKPSPSKATFEQKSYKGSAEFNIEANKITENVAVEAKICNAITNATFDDTIAENFAEGYTLTFTLPKLEDIEEKKLVYDASKSGADGYFIIDKPAIEKSLYWTFAGTLKDGTAFTKSGTIEPKDSEGNAVPLTGAKMTMKFKYSVKDGFLLFNLDVKTSFDDDDIKQDFIMWAPVSTGIIPLVDGDPNIWAKFVTVSADVDTETYDANKVYFQYRKQGVQEWSAISDEIKATSTAKEGVYSAVLKGLEPNTQYEYQLVLYTKETTTTNDAGETVTVPAAKAVIGDADNDGSADEPAVFTTDKVLQVPNASFEEVHTSGDFHIFNSAGVTPTESEGWWGTGNQKQVGTIIDVTSSSTEVPYSVNNSKSVMMMSKKIMGKFAAGNIYSGYFAGLNWSTLQGTVHFGRTKAADGTPFVGRPTGMSFYVKYVAKETSDRSDYVKDLGNYDEGQVRIAIGNWTTGGGSQESPISIYTGDASNNPPAHWNLKTFIGTIAYGEMIFTQEHNDDGWMKVTIPLIYNNTDIPTHIIVSAASSRFGDYFAGGVGSTMYLDDIQLLYDYETSQLTAPKIEPVQ